MIPLIFGTINSLLFLYCATHYFFFELQTD